MTQPVDRYPLEDRDESARWCRCQRPRSLHQGVRLCPHCDRLDLAPGSAKDVEDA